MDSQVPAAPVGVDVVDLEEPRLPRRRRLERVRDRVLDRGERTAPAFGDAELDLWLRWSAKEAAFKAAVTEAERPSARPPFQPSRFRVTLDAGIAAPPSGAPADGLPFTVLHPCGTACGWVAVARPMVLAVAWPGWVDVETRAPEAGATSIRDPEALREPADWRLHLRERFSRREWEAVHSFASAQVRLLARSRAARALGVREEAVEVVALPGTTGRRPPVILVDGHPSGAGISLSHHGRFVAWALRFS